MARVDAALAGLDHPAGARTFGWHPLQAAAQRDALEWIPDGITRALASAALDDYQRLLPRLEALPRQLIHNDGHTDNVLVADGRAAAIVDFGDVVSAPRVCGLAVACAYAALETEQPLRVIGEVAAGYHDVAPLDAVELELLFDLVRTRLAVSACMAARQSRADPDNEYLQVSQHAVPRALAQLAAENRPLFALRPARRLRSRAEPDGVRRAQLPAAARPRAGAGRRRAARHGGRPRLEHRQRGGHPARPGRRDRRASPWSRRARRRRRDGRASAATSSPRRLRRRGLRAADPDEQRSVHVGIDLFLPAGEVVRAPLDGVVEASAECAADYDFGPMAILRHATDGGVPFWTLYGHLSRDSLPGLQPGRVVARGESSPGSARTPRTATGRPICTSSC